MVQFWQTHRQTGDNVKERPYANLYPRLTTRSNTYRVHVVAQSLRKNREERLKNLPARSRATRSWPNTAARTSSSARSIRPTPTSRTTPIAVAQPAQEYDPLDKFYYYRISQVKQSSAKRTLGRRLTTRLAPASDKPGASQDRVFVSALARIPEAARRPGRAPGG